MDEETRTDSIPEDLIAKANKARSYFEDQYKNSKPSCLWSYYSMVRSCLLIYEKIDIKSYGELLMYLKRKTAGCIQKKSKMLTHADILKFLKEADDDSNLLLKVILIIGIFGGCRREELINITTDDVKDHGNFIKICIPKTKTGVSRSFVITEDNEGYDSCFIIRKYMSLRPPHLTNTRLLIGYRNKKFLAQVVGLHTVGNVPRKIANYLGLPDANQYTGHCFRRSSASLLVEGGGDLGTLMNHGGSKSVTVAQGYVENSTRMKQNIANKIMGSFNATKKSSDTVSSSASRVTASTSGVSASTSSVSESITAITEENLLRSGCYFNNLTNCTINVNINKKDS